MTKPILCDTVLTGTLIGLDGPGGPGSPGGPGGPGWPTPESPLKKDKRNGLLTMYFRALATLCCTESHTVHLETLHLYFFPHFFPFDSRFSR